MSRNLKNLICGHPVFTHGCEFFGSNRSTSFSIIFFILCGLDMEQLNGFRTKLKSVLVVASPARQDKQG